MWWLVVCNFSFSEIFRNLQYLLSRFSVATVSSSFILSANWELNMNLTLCRTEYPAVCQVYLNESWLHYSHKKTSFFLEWTDLIEKSLNSWFYLNIICNRLEFIQWYSRNLQREFWSVYEVSWLGSEWLLTQDCLILCFLMFFTLGKYSASRDWNSLLKTHKSVLIRYLYKTTEVFFLFCS